MRRLFENVGCNITKRTGKNSDLDRTINLKQGVIPAAYKDLQRCKRASAAAERSFSMLSKLRHKERPFLPANVEKYLYLSINRLEFVNSLLF